MEKSFKEFIDIVFGTTMFFLLLVNFQEDLGSAKLLSICAVLSIFYRKYDNRTN